MEKLSRITLNRLKNNKNAAKKGVKLMAVLLLRDVDVSKKL